MANNEHREGKNKGEDRCQHRTCDADLEEVLLLWALGGEPQMGIRSDNMYPGWTLKEQYSQSQQNSTEHTQHSSWCRKSQAQKGANSCV